MSHYTHHIDDSGKEPTIIEIGEAYPEELDPELTRFNQTTSRLAGVVLALDRLDRQPRYPSRSPEYRALLEERRAALDEYEKMVSAE